MGRLALPFAVMKLDAHDGVCTERRGLLAKLAERLVVIAHLFVSIDDADDLRRTIEVGRLKHEDARGVGA